MVVNEQNKYNMTSHPLNVFISGAGPAGDLMSSVQDQDLTSAGCLEHIMISTGARLKRQQLSTNLLSQIEF